MPKFVTIILGVICAFSLFFFLEHRNKNKTQPLVTSLCSGEVHCLQAIDDHYSKCFKQNYDIGKIQGLHSDAFATCLNTAASKELFSGKDVVQTLKTANVSYRVYK